MFKSIVLLMLLALCMGTAAWLIFIWSVKKGEYDDIERAKYRMLEDDDQPPATQDDNKGQEKSDP
ncbi:MAG: cbb3-type cytochrome oxidase assembly protein CcoS [Proteobacteria bacterium]|nr:cbb3-type cytochrome oxidase assembly protein CcoS [Pseudomonadota bacterium]MBU1688531.1 cbb3-type cytochrome oxidase assembly protein CcoS [Pseudomonadota bacterium]